MIKTLTEYRALLLEVERLQTVEPTGLGAMRQSEILTALEAFEREALSKIALAADPDENREPDPARPGLLVTITQSAPARRAVGAYRPRMTLNARFAVVC